MLVLSRRKGQSIMIGDEIELTVVDIQGDQIRLGINAPKNISIHRKEVFIEIQKENQEAAQIGNVDLQQLSLKISKQGENHL